MVKSVTKKIQVKKLQIYLLANVFLGGLAPSSQTVGSLLRTHRQVKLAGNSIAPNTNFLYICKHIFLSVISTFKFYFFHGKTVW